MICDMWHVYLFLPRCEHARNACTLFFSSGTAIKKPSLLQVTSLCLRTWITGPNLVGNRQYSRGYQSYTGVTAHQSQKRIRVAKHKAKEESGPKWSDPPEITWLKEQCGLGFSTDPQRYSRKGKSDATGWRRYHPSLSEMPVNWPGHSDEHGLRTDHLTPKSESGAVNWIVSRDLNFCRVAVL